MSNSLQPHGLQHSRPPCPLPTPGACSNSCPSSWWCHPTILSSVDPFSSCLQLFPASGSLPMSQFFASGGQSTGASASASVLPMNIIISFRTDWFDLLAVQGTLKSLLQHHSSKVSILWCSTFFIVQLWHPYMTTGKTIALTSLHLEQILFSDQLIVLWTRLVFSNPYIPAKVISATENPILSISELSKKCLKPISMALVPGPEVISPTIHHSYPLTSIHSFTKPPF